MALTTHEERLRNVSHLQQKAEALRLQPRNERKPWRRSSGGNPSWPTCSKMR